MPPPKEHAHDERKRQLLQAVMNGSYAGQMALVEHIQATNNTDVSISKVVIQFLHPNLIPSTLSDHGHRVLTATGAMSVISTQCRLMIVKGADTQDMVELLKEHYMHFVGWFHFFKKRGAFIVTSGAFLWMMANMDPSQELEVTLLSSRSAVHLIISLWTRRDQNGEHFFPDDDDDEDPRCPMLILLTQILKDDTGQSTFLNLLHDAPSIASRMSHTMRRRIRNLGSRHSKDQTSASCALRHLFDLVHLMRVILYRAIDVLPYFLDPLQSPRLFFDIMQTLHIILRGNVGSAKWSSIVDVLHFVFELLPDLGSGHSNPVAKVRAVVEGGFLQVSILLLLHIPTTSTDYSFILDSMANIVAYTPYSEVATPLCNAIAGLNHDVLSRATGRSTRLLRYWERVYQARKAWNTGVGPPSPDQLCHYVGHSNGSESSSSRPGKSRKCSKCCAVVYCSPHCQKLDWIARHREECSQIQAHAFGQDDCECKSLHTERLPFKYQADLARFVQRTVENNFGLFEDIHRRDYFQVPLHSLLLVIDGLATPLAVGVVSTATFKTHNHFLHRMHANLTQHIHESDTYLVTASFMWGLVVVNVLVRIRRDDQKAFHAMSLTVLELTELAFKVQATTAPANALPGTW